MGDEAEIVNVEEDGDEGHDVRVWEGEVGVVVLDRVNEISDVKSPEERGETTTLGQAFENVDVGVAVGEPVQDAIHEGVVEGTDALPEVEGDVIVVETEEELVPGDSGEDEFDVSEEDNGGIGSVRSVTLVGDVREERVYTVSKGCRRG